MKKIYLYVTYGLLLVGLSACPGPVDPVGYTRYEPVLMSRQQLETSVAWKAAQPIREPGKLYRFGTYLLINERYKGVHVIDNRNPASPVKLGFIQVPGNVDFAVKNQVLYVDNAVDLVAIDIRDLGQVRVTKRVRETFPALVPPDGFGPAPAPAGAPQNAVIVGWTPKTSE